MLFFTTICFAQKNDAPTNSQLNQFYNCAIHDFLIEAKAIYQLQLDTLSFGKHDQFPAIKLPDKINGTVICLVSPAVGEALLKKNSKAFFVNMISWGTTKEYYFKLVVFSKASAHQFDWNATYQFDSKNQEKKLNSQFKNYSFGK